MDQNPEHPPLSAHHFIGVLAHLQAVLDAELIAWDARTSSDAQQRLDRIAAAIRQAAAKVRDAL